MEMTWLLEAAQRIARLPGALAWFCPSGEVLMSPEQLEAELLEARATQRPPVNAVCATRIWHHDEWGFVDTAGMSQFALPDLEFAAPSAGLALRETAIAFKNLCIYLIEKGDVIQSGNSADGPAGKWCALRCAKSINPPERQALRWNYDGAPAPPAGLGPRQVMPPPPPDPAEQFVRSLLESYFSEARAWQLDLPLYRATLARFQQTADYLALAMMTTESRSGNLEETMRGAVLIPAFPAIGNVNPEMPLRPTLVVGTFDSNIEAIVHCAILAERMGSLYGEAPSSDPHERLIQEIVADDTYVCRKRVRLPEPIADGFAIYAFHVLLSPEQLEHQRGQPLMRPLLAVPGPGPAPVVAIPLPVLKGQPGPSIYATLTGEEPPPVSEMPPAGGKKSGCRKPALIAAGIFFVLSVIVKCSGCARPPEQDKSSGDKTFFERLQERLEEKRSGKKP